jgi:tyrosine decarboxylase/aspartate 1-decarboxylase
LESKGLSKKQVLKQLESKLQADFTFDSGKIIGSMCTRPHPFAAKVYSRYLEKNLGDPGLFPGVAGIENEAVQMIGSLLMNEEPSGHIVSGGTEANILALYTAKRVTKNGGNEVVVPETAHRSFDKAGDLLGLKIVKAKLDNNHRVDLNAVKRVINRETIALVGIAGTTDLGAVDPLQELSEMAMQKDLYLHVDAAFGGFVLPFLKQLGYPVYTFDFSLPAVCSITVDPHKMGLAPLPAGGIIFRSHELEDKIAWKIPYLSGGETCQSTLTGTRSGASAIAVWALMKYLGSDGYKKMVDRCMRLTLMLTEAIRRIDGLNIVVEPTMNMIGITSSMLEIGLLADKLRAKGWAVSLFPAHVRVVVMPHVKEQHMDKFVGDLKNIAKKLR